MKHTKETVLLLATTIARLRHEVEGLTPPIEPATLEASRDERFNRHLFALQCGELKWEVYVDASDEAPEDYAIDSLGHMLEMATHPRNPRRSHV